MQRKIVPFVLIFVIICFSLNSVGFSAKKVSLSPSRQIPSSTELMDLKVAVGAYHDGLYKIAAKYLQNFLKNYPKSAFGTKVSLLLADAYLKTRRPREALATYQSILDKNRKLNDNILLRIHYAMYGILKHHQSLPKAIVHLKFIIDLSKRKRIRNAIVYQSFLDLAQYYRASGQDKKAEGLLDQLLSFSPPSPWEERTLLQKASLLAAHKQFDALRELMKPFVKQNSKLEGPEREFYLYWALSNLKLKRFCAAQKAYKKLIRPYTDTPTLPFVIDGYILSFCRCFADENVRNATFQSLSKRFAKRPSILFRIHYLQGLIYYRENNDKKASMIWIKTLREFPDHPKLSKILIPLDKIFRKMHNLKEWESILLKISKDKNYLSESREIADFLLGNLYFSRGAYGTALPFYFGIINNKKFRKFCLERIVLCYYYLGKYKEARTNLGILLLENPQLSDKPLILFLNADLMLRAGKTEKAIKVLKRLVKENTLIHQGKENIWVIKAKLELGKISFLKKDYDTAKRYLLDVLKQGMTPIGDNRIAAFYLGLISEKEKNPELSATYFQIASLSGNQLIRVESLFRLGLAKKSLKMYNESEKVFKYIINNYSNFPEWKELSILQLAEIYISLKQDIEAKKQLKILIETSNDDDIKAEAGRWLRVIKNKSQGRM